MKSTKKFEEQNMKYRCSNAKFYESHYQRTGVERMKNIVVALLLVVLVAGAQAAEKKVEVTIQGMTCNGCVSAVQNSLHKIQGVKQANVSLETNSATVLFDDKKVNEKKITEAVVKAGYKVTGVADAAKADKKGLKQCQSACGAESAASCCSKK